jgi:predicted porin
VAKDQSLTFAYKQWIFVSSTGLVPYYDSSYGLTYHVNLTKQLGLDLGARYLEANYTLGNDVAGSAPSLRDDKEYEGSAGLNYLIVPHLTASVAYVYDKGANGLNGLAANLDAPYRDFEHGVITFGVKYAF